MAVYSTNEFRSGLKSCWKGDPCSVIENEFVKPARGRRSTGQAEKPQERPGVGAHLQVGRHPGSADVVDRELTYLYNDGEFWYFMDPNTYEQTARRTRARWANPPCGSRKQDVCTVTLYNGAPLGVTPPNFVELPIVTTDPVCVVTPPRAAPSRPR